MTLSIPACGVDGPSLQDGGSSGAAGSSGDDGGAGSDDGTMPADDSTGGGDGTDSLDGADDAADTGGGPTGEGLPCEIDDMLQTYCRSCHGPSMLAAPQMLTRDDMLGDSITLPGATVAEAAAQRLDSTTQPMPPLPAAPVPTDVHDAFLAWVDAGMPSGDCTPTDPGTDPFDVDPVCTSDSWWTGGLYEESPHMDPGRACIDCHNSPIGEEGPSFAAAGTLYPTAHEPDDCFGVDGNTEDVYVELSNANGVAVQVPINSAGNFYIAPFQMPAGLAPPYYVRVVAGDLERTMATPADHGDCNLCHTQNGDQDAPGRVLIPF